jgi:hypothetical protein
MRVVVHYRVGITMRDWVCEYSRLNHIIAVCEEKGFDIIGVESLA